ncbi:MAG: RIO kinase 1, partial [Gammaproteobacteria bacterium]
NVAPRLNDVSMSAEQALEDHAQVMHYVLLMLCAGIVHGDLSEFNVLVDDYGPVIIDLPQAVNAAANNNAFSMLQRDVRNMTDYYAEFAPELKETHYAEEMWALFQTGKLTPETELTGYFEFDESETDVDTVLEEIKAAFEEEQARKERMSDANSDDE